MSCEVVIRAARPEDWPARERLVREGMTTHWREAFMYFFFHELTLELCVLSGAVLFIFCGCGLRVCACVPLFACVFVAVCVSVKHAALADTHVQRIRSETFGLVATVGAPLSSHNQFNNTHLYSEVVGTVSLAEHWSEPYCGWVYALAVAEKWRRRGVARKLLRAAREGGGGAGGWTSLAAAASQLQDAARELLYSESWEGAMYQRRLLGSALTLPLVAFHTHLHPPTPASRALPRTPTKRDPWDST